jgi:hypothetical protein
MPDSSFEADKHKGFSFILMTNDPDLAREAERAGVERVGPDLEILGKEARQGHLDARISRHSVEDVLRIRDALTEAEVFVRVNPIHPGSEAEIERVLDAGARAVMLPMFRTADEVSQFVGRVRGRATPILLVETPQAMMRIDEIVCIEGVGEVHFGLNDLHLGLRLHSHFEVLCSDLMDGLAGAARRKGLRYGFGAVARIGDQGLPIPPDQVVGELVRLGASQAILSRYFFPPESEPFDFAGEIKRLRDRIAHWKGQSMQALLENRRALRESVRVNRERKPRPLPR